MNSNNRSNSAASRNRRIHEAYELLEDQEDQEIVQIDSNGNISRLEPERAPESKSIILHDPHGEYAR